jgi:hypothetical protein
MEKRGCVPNVVSANDPDHAVTLFLVFSGRVWLAEAIQK